MAFNLQALKNRMAALGGALDAMACRALDAKTLTGAGAACVYVAAADGSIDPDEKMEAIDAIMAHPVLGKNSKAVIAAFEKYEPFAKSTKMADLGQLSAAIKGIAAEDAEAIMGICVDIGAADGNFDADEQAVVKRMCKWLNVDHTMYGIE